MKETSLQIDECETTQTSAHNPKICTPRRDGRYETGAKIDDYRTLSV